MAGEVSCCRECGTIFQSLYPTAFCPKHKYIDDELFTKIEEYLLKHPFSNALQISNTTNISTNEILRYINEGKLVMVNGNVNISKMGN